MEIKDKNNFINKINCFEQSKWTWKIDNTLVIDGLNK